MIIHVAVALEVQSRGCQDTDMQTVYKHLEDDFSIGDRPAQSSSACTMRAVAARVVELATTLCAAGAPAVDCAAVVDLAGWMMPGVTAATMCCLPALRIHQTLGAQSSCLGQGTKTAQSDPAPLEHEANEKQHPCPFQACESLQAALHRVTTFLRCVLAVLSLRWRCWLQPVLSGQGSTMVAVLLAALFQVAAEQRRWSCGGCWGCWGCWDCWRSRLRKHRQPQNTFLASGGE